jgi:hypothetical protein
VLSCWDGAGSGEFATCSRAGDHLSFGIGRAGKSMPSDASKSWPKVPSGLELLTGNCGASALLLNWPFSDGLTTSAIRANNFRSTPGKNIVSSGFNLQM